MASNERYGSNLAFIDLLFNILVGFVFLFVVAFLMINPIAKKADIITPAEFLITLSWPDQDQNDFDLWVRDPVQNYIGFRSKDVGVTNLDRDDLGSINDRVSIAPGKDVIVSVNREVTSIRGILPGEYVVSVHLYNGSRITDAGVPVTVELQKINPYSILFNETRIMTDNGQIENFVRFVINEEGKIIEVGETNDSAVPLHNLPEITNRRPS